MARASRHRRLRAALGVAGLLAIPACGGAPTAQQAGIAAVSPSPTARDPLSSATTRRLDKAVKKVMLEASVPGVIVGLWMGDRGYVRAFGVADQEAKSSMSPRLYMRIGSETKTFTVTALLRLVDKGEVGLDDPVSRYVPDVPGGDRITLRQLAGMRSGLYPYTSDPGFMKALAADPKRSFTPRELLDYSFAHPPSFQPGQKFEYSNTNTILLGLVIEKISGEPLGEFIRREVLVPAGLKRTVFPRGARFPRPHAHGYTQQTAGGETVDATGWNTSWGWAAGAMVSTLEDLRVWAPTLANGSLLAPATRAERMKNPSRASHGLSYGLGVFDDHGWLGHNGSLPGYQTVAVHLPSQRATLVVLANTDIGYEGHDVSTLFARAITRIATPRHVYTLPAAPAASASPRPSKARR